MTDRQRRLSLAHLSMISVAPDRFIRAGAAAGFDDVGLRLVPTSSGIDHEVLGNDAALSNLASVLDDSGIGVLDVEVLRIREPHANSDPRPLLDAANALGARYVITTLEDPDTVRRADSLAAVAELAGERSLTLTVEYMLFSAAADLDSTLTAIDSSGTKYAAALPDVLHHTRSGGLPDDLSEVRPELIPYAQICGAHGRGRAADVAAARAEAISTRLPPDEGDLPVCEFIAALPSLTTLSVEAPLAGLSNPNNPAAHARFLLNSAHRVLGWE